MADLGSHWEIIAPKAVISEPPQKRRFWFLVLPSPGLGQIAEESSPAACPDVFSCSDSSGRMSKWTQELCSDPTCIILSFPQTLSSWALAAQLPSLPDLGGLALCPEQPHSHSGSTLWGGSLDTWYSWLSSWPKEGSSRYLDTKDPGACFLLLSEELPCARNVEMNKIELLTSGSTDWREKGPTQSV